MGYIDPLIELYDSGVVTVILRSQKVTSSKLKNSFSLILQNIETRHHIKVIVLLPFKPSFEKSYTKGFHP